MNNGTESFSSQTIIELSHPGVVCKKIRRVRCRRWYHSFRATIPTRAEVTQETLGVTWVSWWWFVVSPYLCCVVNFCGAWCAYIISPVAIALWMMGTDGYQTLQNLRDTCRPRFVKRSSCLKWSLTAGKDGVVDFVEIQGGVVCAEGMVSFVATNNFQFRSFFLGNDVKCTQNKKDTGYHTLI